MRFKTLTRTGKPHGCRGDVDKHKNGNFTITLHKALSPLEKAIAYFHEQIHIIDWTWLPFDDEDREHRFIAAMERDLRKNIKKYWEGEKE